LFFIERGDGSRDEESSVYSFAAAAKAHVRSLGLRTMRDCNYP
jgi:hypothetical protein